MVDPLSYILFQLVFHDWCNKSCGMWSPVYEVVHIKEPLLLIRKSSQCGGSRFSLSHLFMVIWIGHTVKNHRDSERGNLLPPLHRLLFAICSKGSFIYVSVNMYIIWIDHSTDGIAHTTAFVVPVLEHWLKWEFFSHWNISKTNITINENVLTLPVK